MDPSAPLGPGRKRGAYDRSATSTLTRAASAVDFGSRLEPANFYRTVFRAALREAGLPASDSDGTKGVRLHDLRHTLATTASTNGVPYQQVSEWLGHASYVLTLTVYAHWIPQEEDRWVDRMARPAPAPVETRARVVPIDARRTSEPRREGFAAPSASLRRTVTPPGPVSAGPLLLPRLDSNQ